MAQKLNKLALTWVLLSLFPVLVFAAESVHVAGLFKDRALVVIDGQRQLLAVGGASHAGVQLISASSNSAILEVNGVREVYLPESRVQLPLVKPRRAEVQIWRDGSGLFETIGSINGRLFSMLVDTGATKVAMSGNHARQLGIDYVITGTPVRVTTASGEEHVYQVNLKTVKIGEVQLRDVGALVIPGNYPDKVLLGMSFLERVEMFNEGNRLVLRKMF